MCHMRNLEFCAAKRAFPLLCIPNRVNLCDADAENHFFFHTSAAGAREAGGQLLRCLLPLHNTITQKHRTFFFVLGKIRQEHGGLCSASGFDLYCSDRETHCGTSIVQTPAAIDCVAGGVVLCRAIFAGCQ